MELELRKLEEYMYSIYDDDGEFVELFVFKWTSLLIPPTTLLVVNLVVIVQVFPKILIMVINQGIPKQFQGFRKCNLGD